MCTSGKNARMTLSDGRKMPMIGLGTWNEYKTGEVKQAVIAAIDAGYRHIDTAYRYKSEVGIGDALKEKIEDGTVKREDMFITTKIWSTFHHPSRVEHALHLSLKALQLDYVDLYLMHSPMALKYTNDDDLLHKDKDGELAFDDVHYIDTWKAMEPLVKKGMTKSIGVSNFNISQLKDLLNIIKVPCVMNQIENHPCLDQSELINFCKTKHIAITSFSPLGGHNWRWASADEPHVRENSIIKEIADTQGCTTVQVLIAYNLCQGLACIPKSVTASRIETNLSALDVTLGEADLRKLDGLGSEYRTGLWTLFSSHTHYPFEKSN